MNFVESGSVLDIFRMCMITELSMPKAF